MKLFGIGYGNMISADRVVSVVSPDAAPVKRLVADARSDGRVIDDALLNEMYPELPAPKK